MVQMGVMIVLQVKTRSATCPLRGTQLSRSPLSLQRIADGGRETLLLSRVPSNGVIKRRKQP